MVQDNPQCAITSNCVHEISTSDQGISEMSHQEHGVYQINWIFTESGGTYQIHPLRIFLHDTMALDVRCSSLSAEARVWFQPSPHGVCSGISGNGRGFPPNTLVFPFHYHSTTAQYPYITHIKLALYNLSNWHHHFTLKTMLSWIILMKYVTDEIHNFNSFIIVICWWLPHLSHLRWW
jgi:hypothetical protein